MLKSAQINGKHHSFASSMKYSTGIVWKKIERNYSIEALFIVITLYFLLLLSILFVIFYRNGFSNVQPFATLISAGLIFMAGQMYGRIKDRRENKRKKAIEIFYEWHSKDIRESRMYVSHWISFQTGDERTELPALSSIEKSAKSKYEERLKESAKLKEINKSEEPPKKPDFEAPTVHELFDAQLMELHFFRIYQFFERWALLLKYDEVDAGDADRLMRLYKPWYLLKFIKPWHSLEVDPYIMLSLNEIVKHVSPDRSGEIPVDDQIEFVKEEIKKRDMAKAKA